MVPVSLFKHIHWNYSNDTTPTESDSTAVEQAHIKPVSATLDFGKDFAIVLKDAWWPGLALHVGLRRWMSM